MHPFLNTAITAARKAGNVITGAWSRQEKLQLTEKGRHDYSTNIDRRAEEIIIDVLQRAYPQHSFLAEECGSIEKDRGHLWVIDPLDGTHNFIRGLPHFAVSIALLINEQVSHSVIYDPIRQELFTASRGSGAQLNNHRIRCRQQSLDGALLGTGFPMRNPNDFPSCMRTIQALYSQVSSLRASGCAALDLAYVACGRLDGYFKTDLSSWDVAAGALLVYEAGGQITDYAGGKNYLYGKEIVAAGTKLHPELLKMMSLPAAI